jgi:probable HAF family extracellular repeat protein
MHSRLSVTSLVGLIAAVATASLIHLDASTSTNLLYSVHAIPTLGGAQNEVTAINNADQVVGASATTGGQSHGFVYNVATDQIVDIGTLGGNSSFANAINDNGLAAGWATNAAGEMRAVVFDSVSGELTDLHPFVALGGTSSSALGVNGRGQVVGWSETGDKTHRAFMLDVATGQFTDLGTLGGPQSVAFSINDTAIIVGYAAAEQVPFKPVRWDCAAQPCAAAVLGDGGGAYAISNAGHIAGSAAIGEAAAPHAFLLPPGAQAVAVTHDLGVLGGVSSRALATNTAGHVVGQSDNDMPDDPRAVIVTESGMQDLNDVIAADSGRTLRRATGINDSGIIVADGVLDGTARAFVLQPSVRAATTTALTSSHTSYTYGTAVTLTGVVRNEGSAVSDGTVEFFDEGTSLGSAQLTNGTATLMTGRIAAGTRSITAAYRGTAKFDDSMSPAVTQTVTKASTTTTYIFYPYAAQYSDVITFKATVSPASIGGRAPARVARFKVGTETIGEAPLQRNYSTGTLEAYLKTALVEDGSTGQMRPGSKLTYVEFVDVDPSVTLIKRTGSLSVRQEEARAAYTGPTTVRTACPTCATATIRLEARVWEFEDGAPGDIRNASVMFVDRATGRLIGNGILDPSTSTSEAAHYYYNWAANIGTKAAQSFTVGTIVTNYYLRNSTTENGTVTVSKK